MILRSATVVMVNDHDNDCESRGRYLTLPAFPHAPGNNFRADFLLQKD
jgi:hypothetical protein